VERPVETIQKLIDLAADERTPLNEARAAALRAVRLIRQHGLEVVPSGSTARRFGFGDLLEEMLRDASRREQSRSRRRWPDVTPARARPRTPPESVSSEEPFRPGYNDEVVRTRSAGVCSVCRDVYGRGERVVWMPDLRHFCHTECYAKARAGRPA